MRKILEPLRVAGEKGVEMSTGNGTICQCHPIFAAHVGDYPEQVLVTGVKTGECPCCPQPAKELGDYTTTPPFCDLDAVLHALEVADAVMRKDACIAAGIKPIYRPYWQDLPYANVFLSITPDILHQLYQGVIKHLVAWIHSAYNEAELDAHARRLPRNHHTRVFTKGITSLYQLTGREHADIARILLSLIAELPLPDGMSLARLLRSVRAILDFLYLAQYPVHTDESLMLLDDALDRFHANKDIFIDLGIRTNFNIPKLHFLRHYVYLIKRLGTTDNFNTEYTERLHIDLAKDAYEATNSKDEFPQMTLWLERREKVIRHQEYITWQQKGCPLLSASHIQNAPPTDCLKMTKHPSDIVLMDTIAEDHNTPFFVDALARYIVKHCHPNYTRVQIEREAVDILFTFR